MVEPSKQNFVSHSDSKFLQSLEHILRTPAFMIPTEHGTEFVDFTFNVYNMMFEISVTTQGCFEKKFDGYAIVILPVFNSGKPQAFSIDLKSVLVIIGRFLPYMTSVNFMIVHKNKPNDFYRTKESFLLTLQNNLKQFIGAEECDLTAPPVDFKIGEFYNFLQSLISGIQVIKGREKEFVLTIRNNKILRKKLKDIIEGTDTIARGIFDVKTTCDVSKIQNLWNQKELYGPIIASDIYISCVKHHVEIEKLIEVWNKTRREIEKLSSEDFVKIYHTLYVQEECFYNRMSFTFIYDIYINKGISCVSSSYFVFMINYLSKQRRRMLLTLTRDHMFVLYTKDKVAPSSPLLEIHSFETTQGHTATEEKYDGSNKNELIICLSGNEQILGLMLLIDNRISMCNLDFMFGSILHRGEKLQTFREFASNVQKPTMLWNIDGHAFAYYDTISKECM